MVSGKTPKKGHIFFLTTEQPGREVKIGFGAATGG